jgi:hypothetical protein
MRLNRADLPTLGRPTMAMSPDLMTVGDILPVTEIKMNRGSRRESAQLFAEV